MIFLVNFSIVQSLSCLLNTIFEKMNSIGPRDITKLQFMSLDILESVQIYFIQFAPLPGEEKRTSNAFCSFLCLSSDVVHKFTFTKDFKFHDIFQS